MTTNYDWRAPFSYTFTANSWYNIAIGYTHYFADSTYISASATLTPSAITVSGPNFTLKDLGNCASDCLTAKVGTAEGDPINAGTGNKYQAETDFTGGLTTGLALTRHYNSADPAGSAFGSKWHSTWHRGLGATSDKSSVTVTKADGRQEIFNSIGHGAYAADPDVADRLSATQTGWQLTTADDMVETYTLAGLLTAVTTRAGLVTSLTYDANNRLIQVTGPFGHKLTFAYDANNRVLQMTAPDGGVYSYAYDAKNNLASVVYPNGSIRKYVYENATFSNALTGIIDENGARFATWAYESQGRAVSSQHAGGADLTKLAYNADGTTTVTDARGNAHSYIFMEQFDSTKPLSLSDAPSPSAGGKAFTYDANGFVASRTDWDGNVTTYTHDARGDETSRVEASGTTLARTISTTWLSTFHLPTLITEPNRSTAFTMTRAAIS